MNTTADLNLRLTFAFHIGASRINLKLIEGHTYKYKQHGAYNKARRMERQAFWGSKKQE